MPSRPSPGAAPSPPGAAVPSPFRFKGKAIQQVGRIMREVEAGATSVEARARAHASSAPDRGRLHADARDAQAHIHLS
ncbi:hypothetical protein [Streptomyces sp. P17]|uniref:hypothetical protein n=1 Tax=Streptomyces sp. P17 TaxID=3074716 RepID=UPI0028F424A9|nr:hypothetical protein [Streptomyces sp. P17]MDT9696536.1 hypothetical protein [Streptomyces sp. P17]